MSAKNILEISSLHKTYAKGTTSEIHALRGISLEVKKGEMIAIMGPSGCGKTTFLNMIGGIDNFDSGSLYIDGIDIKEFSDAQMTEFRSKHLGFIFQLFNLFPFLTATQNVMIPLLIQKVPKARARRDTERLLRELGLSEHLKHYPAQLSGGQQQRVAIARSLITQPTILLGDEPTGDLDSATSLDIIQLFRRINREHQQTLVLVTHSKWIAKHCDRIVKIRDGRIEEDIKVEGEKSGNWFTDISSSANLSGGSGLETREKTERKIAGDELLVAVDLFKNYQTHSTTVHALRGINLVIKRGEFIVITGPSGSGKTTLLNILAGLDTPDRGHVYIDGINIGKLNDNRLTQLRRDKIGFIFQYYNLLPILTNSENVAYPAEIGGNRKNLRKRVQANLEAVGLQDYKRQFPNKLSGGQMQRVTIARSLINVPNILFADEPTGDLDSVTGEQIMDVINELHKKGTTIVLVTHDPSLLKYADRIISMRDGLITPS